MGQVCRPYCWAHTKPSPIMTSGLNLVLVRPMGPRIADDEVTSHLDEQRVKRKKREER